MSAAMLDVDPMVSSRLTREERATLIEANLPLVNHVLYQIASHFPRHADRDELAQAATLGLVEAAHRFDPARGVPFDRWAAVRIRGAILDSVRSLDFAPRSLRAASRQLEDARTTLSTELARTPTDLETAHRLGMTANELGTLTGRVHRALVLSLDAPSGPEEDGTSMCIADIVTSNDADACDVLESRELLAYLGDALRLLPERLRAVVTGYFIDGRTSADLAEEFGVTESRVSQLRSEALSMLRAGIEAQYGQQSDEADVSRRAVRRREDYAEAIAAASTPLLRLRGSRRPQALPVAAPAKAPVRTSRVHAVA
ncbi:MAG: sigma-70 family RNA polymerase sigma factor [Actinomycetota bacterium]